MARFFDEGSTLRQIMIDGGFNFSSPPTRWDGEPFEEPGFTGNTALPAIWLDASIASVSADYLTASEDWLRAVIDFSIMWEPIVNDTPARLLAEEILASFQTARDNGDIPEEYKIRLSETDLEQWGEDGPWLRKDLTVPYWRFPAAAG